MSRVPYIAPDGEVRTDGRLVLPVNDSAGSIMDVIGDHTIWFAGEEPRDKHGTPLGASIPPRDIVGIGTVPWMLSFKPPSGHYPGLYEKVRSYALILSSAAQQLDPTVNATPGAAFQAVEDDLPFVYGDTNTTRAGLTALNSVFRGSTKRCYVVATGTAMASSFTRPPGMATPRVPPLSGCPTEAPMGGHRFIGDGVEGEATCWSPKS